jgi:microcystin-dependent protein
VEPTISPSFLFPNTAWERISEGRFIVGVGSSSDINGASKTFLFSDNDGEYEHTLSIAEMPTHRHGFTGANGNTNQQTRSPFELTNDDAEQTWEPGSEANIGDIGILDTGGNQAHNNIPPSFGLYIWKRIS